MGLGPKGYPTFVERTYAKLGLFPPTRAPLPPSGRPVRFGSGSTLFFSNIHIVWIIFFSKKHVCSWRHFLAYLYSCFSYFLKYKNKKYSHFTLSSLSFCATVLQTFEFVGVLRLRTASEERGPFYPGRRLSTILDTI